MPFLIIILSYIECLSIKNASSIELAFLLLVAGLEPARDCSRGILSPLRLPIPPHQPTLCPMRASRANGQRWIRTTEGVASRFTVCPLWPLGNLPILELQYSDLSIVAHILLFCKRNFWKFVQIHISCFSGTLQGKSLPNK